MTSTTGAVHADPVVERLIGWFTREAADLPWRRTRGRWPVLVSEAMLQATPVARVVPYYERFMARWPTPADLPGVGGYTAAAIRCFADGEDVLPRDTNAERVVARRFAGAWPGAGGRGWEAGQAVMDLGRLWCTARAPRCDDGCPLREGCAAADEGTVVALTPVRRPQGRYEGSMRQRRGALLGELAAAGWADPARDPEAAASLVADGLADARDGRLVRVT